MYVMVLNEYIEEYSTLCMSNDLERVQNIESQQRLSDMYFEATIHMVIALYMMLW